MVEAVDVIVISVSPSLDVLAREVNPLDDFDLVGSSAFSGVMISRLLSCRVSSRLFAFPFFFSDDSVRWMGVIVHLASESLSEGSSSNPKCVTAGSIFDMLLERVCSVVA